MKKFYYYFAIILLLSNFLLADDWTVGVGGKSERYGRSNEIGPSSWIWLNSFSTCNAQSKPLKNCDGETTLNVTYRGNGSQG